MNSIFRIADTFLKKTSICRIKSDFFDIEGIQRTILHIYLHAKMASHKTAN